MDGWRRPDGRIMIPAVYHGEGVIAHGMRPIGPDDPEYARWDAHLAEQEAARGTLAERFAESRGFPVWVLLPGWAEPRYAYPAYENDVPGPQRLSLEVRSTADRGVVVALRGGDVVLDGVPFEEVVVWGDPAGRRTDLDLRPAGDHAELAVLPVWRGPDGAPRSGEGEAGVLVEDRTTPVVLRCSVGDGPLDFGAVEVTFTRTLSGH